MCKMVLSDLGKMKRDGISVSLEVDFNDDYDEVVKKAAETLQLSSVNNFRLRGALIPRSEDWCVGKHKQSLHYASDTIELGLGYLRKAMDPTSV